MTVRKIGMIALGLLVCGIFAARLTSMNSLLNVYSGTFVRNFYIRVVNKNASETKQILVGRLFILFYGLTWVVVALLFKNIKSLQLFDLILLAAAPCTAMVFVWSNLCDGDPSYTLSQVALNDVIMVFAFAPIGALLLGPRAMLNHCRSPPTPSPRRPRRR